MARLDPVRLEHELGRRGLTQAQLAQLAGISERTLSRARCGGRLNPGTLNRLAAALLRTPVMPGADLVLGLPDQKDAAGSPSAALGEGAGDAARSSTN
ncbi:MAG: helix-turn-helix domain-containing protein [Candidatus Dormibacterales bacterium]